MRWTDLPGMGKRDLGGSQKLDFEMHVRHPVGHILGTWRYDFGVRTQQATNLEGFGVCELRVRWCGVCVLKKRHPTNFPGLPGRSAASLMERGPGLRTCTPIPKLSVSCFRARKAEESLTGSFHTGPDVLSNPVRLI